MVVCACLFFFSQVEQDQGDLSNEHVPNTATVSDTWNIPENDIGKYLGPKILVV